MKCGPGSTALRSTMQSSIPSLEVMRLPTEAHGGNRQADGQVRAREVVTVTDDLLGPSGARNTGVENTSGDVLLF